MDLKKKKKKKRLLGCRALAYRRGERKKSGRPYVQRAPTPALRGQAVLDWLGP